MRENIWSEIMQISRQEETSTVDDGLMILSVGPQHLGSGHFRLTIVYCDPDPPGYVHRGEEKMCEYRNFTKYTTFRASCYS